MVEREETKQINDRLSGIISIALDESFPDMLPQDKALCLNYLKTSVRRSIHELFQILEDGYTDEYVNTIILTSLLDTGLE